MKRYRKIISRVLQVSLALLCVLGIIFPELAPDFLVGIFGAGGGALLASTPFTGPATRENAVGISNHVQEFVSKKITEIKPDEYALDTMMRKIRKAETPGEIKVYYEEVVYRGVEDQLNGAITAAGNATDNSVELTTDMTGGNIWNVDDTVYVPSITSGTSPSGAGLRLLVTAVDASTNKITVKATNAATEQRVPSIADNTPIYRLGNAKTELDAQNGSYYKLPAQDYNYCQKHMTQLERSTTEAKIKTKSGYGYGEKRKQTLYDFRSGIEATNFFGQRSITPNGNEKHYTADGIEAKITRKVEFGSGGGAVDPTTDDVADLAEAVFANVAGSKDRVMFAGKKVVTALQKITYTKNIDALGTEIVHGVKCEKLKSYYGTIYVVHSKTLDLRGWQKKAFVVDLEHIHKHDFEAMHATPLELKKAGVRNVQDAYTIEEQSCLTIRYAGANGVHAVWEPAA